MTTETETLTLLEVPADVQRLPAPAAQPAIAEVAPSPQSVSEPVSLLSAVIAAASNPSVDIDKMERLIAMHERMTSQANEEAFNRAMNSAQAEMSPIATDADNKQTRSRYATYAAIDRALRPIYTKHGFAISFDTGDGAPDGCIRVFAYVSCAGFMRTYKADMPADGKGAKGGDVMTKTHASGSAMSYAMRYLLKLIFNVAIGEDDNDGNGDESADKARLSIANKVYDGLMRDLAAVKTDGEASALWATGSKALAATENKAAYDDFKEEVLKVRRAFQAKKEPA